MFWLFALGAIVVISAIVMGVSNWKDSPGDGIGAFFFTIAFGGLCALVIAMVTNAILIEVIGSHYETESTANLAALQDGSSSSGSFFLGSGTYDEHPSFFYYEKSGNEYHLEHIDADLAVVIETSEAPRVEYQHEVGDHPFWAIPVAGYDHVKFYVPEGSVISNYSLDAG